MHGSTNDLPVALDIPEGQLWQVEWGGQTIEFGRFTDTLDPAPLFKGLPDDRCQCPHWGYVIKGRVRFRYGDHEEVYEAGDAYYAPPGHLAVLEEGLEYVEFSPSSELAKTMEVVERNMATSGG